MENPKVLNVLVIDDEYKIGKMFKKWLSLGEHRMKFVLDGKEAIHLVKEEHFNIVFLDIVMPGIPAVEVLEKIREASPKTKIIMITGKLVDSGLMKELRLKGASDFLQKPFKLKDVMKHLSD